MQPIKLIATDLDGTLFINKKNGGSFPSQRVQKALAAALEAGILLIPATARPFNDFQRLKLAQYFSGYAICSNGALCAHLSKKEVLFSHSISPDLQQDFLITLQQSLPDILLASLCQSTSNPLHMHMLMQQGYGAVSNPAAFGLASSSSNGRPLSDLLARPSLKLMLRHPTLSASELFSIIQSISPSELTVTSSGAPFVEVSAANVNKASALAQLCGHLGISSQQVMAFGDAPNDAQMLAWAGHGVAMADAHPSAKAAAKAFTASCQQDGVALTIEALLQRSPI